LLSEDVYQMHDDLKTVKVIRVWSDDEGAGELQGVGFGADRETSAPVIGVENISPAAHAWRYAFRKQRGASTK
jgi:hypothetical protein